MRGSDPRWPTAPIAAVYLGAQNEGLTLTLTLTLTFTSEAKRRGSGPRWPTAPTAAVYLGAQNESLDPRIRNDDYDYGIKQAGNDDNDF